MEDGTKMEKEKGTGGGSIPPDFWVWALAAAVVLWALGLSLSGCSRTVYVPVETVRADTVWRARAYADSTYLMDSIVVTLDSRRDTVVRTEYRYRTHWRDRVRTDTVYRTRRDSVRVEIPVERGPTAWQRAFISLGHGAAAFIAALLAGWLWRKLRKR